MNIKYRVQRKFNEDDVRNLYMDAMWTSYTDDMPSLLRALRNSNCIITAWDGPKLVGLVRILTDKETILLIQDILVLKDYRKNGIGTQLIKLVLNRFQVRQTLLQTDLQDKISNSFYQRLGFVKSQDFETQCSVLYR